MFASISKKYWNHLYYFWNLRKEVKINPYSRHPLNPNPTQSIDRMVTYGPHLPLPKPPEPPAICDIVAPSDSDDDEEDNDDNDENSAPVATAAATVDADADHDGTISECPNNFSYSHTSKKFGGRKSELILDDIPIPEGDDRSMHTFGKIEKKNPIIQLNYPKAQLYRDSCDVF